MINNSLYKYINNLKYKIKNYIIQEIRFIRFYIKFIIYNLYKYILFIRKL